MPERHIFQQRVVQPFHHGVHQDQEQRQGCGGRIELPGLSRHQSETESANLSYGRRLLRQGKRSNIETYALRAQHNYLCTHAQPNGADQNDGVVKLDDIDGKTNTAKEACLQKCLQYQTRTSTKVTGCEVIWDQSNRGCYG